MKCLLRSCLALSLVLLMATTVPLLMHTNCVLRRARAEAAALAVTCHGDNWKNCEIAGSTRSHAAPRRPSAADGSSEGPEEPQLRPLLDSPRPTLPSLSGILEGSVAIGGPNATYRVARGTVDGLNQDTPAARAESRAIVAVLSHRREYRDAIRRTWAFDRPRHVWFVVGGAWTEELAAELRRHQDVLWVGVEEYYRGITRKVQAALAAIDALLLHYEYVFKTDQDCYVRMDSLLELLRPGGKHESSLYWGSCTSRSRIVRDPSHRWFLPHRMLTGRTVYPPYAIGAGYVLRRPLVRCVIGAMAAVETMPIEDAYIGALVERCGANCTDDGDQVLLRFEQSWNSAAKYRPWVVLHDLMLAQRFRFAHQKTCCKFGYNGTRSCRNVDCADLNTRKAKPKVDARQS